MAHKSSACALSRRDWLKLTTAGVVSYSMSGWMEQLARASQGGSLARRRSCILLWMNGGPSQIDTFDPKPGHANGGQFRAIQTSVPGIQISEHLPGVARNMQDIAIVRSMSTREADHGRATYYLRTGYLPGGPINYPAMGALVSKAIGRETAELPNFVSVAPFTFFSPAAYTAGFLGPNYAPMVLGTQQPNFLGGNQGETEEQRIRRVEEALRVPDLDIPNNVNAARAAARFGLLSEMEEDFQETRSALPSQSHRAAYQRAVALMRSSARRAFNLDEEPATVRDRYGRVNGARTLFGQGCLLARRLVERGVPFVEVSLGALEGNNLGWDTHSDNFNTVKRLCETLDPAWSALMDDLRSRGLLQDTLIVWMGEFGRTPRISGSGRDHWANAWSAVLAGGGIRGGQVYGRTSADGTTVETAPTPVKDFLATVMSALGIDFNHRNMSDVGRPIRIVDERAHAIQEVLA